MKKLSSSSHPLIFSLVFIFLETSCLYAQTSRELLERVDADNSNPTVWYQLGLAYIRENNHSLAIEAFDKATHLDRRFAEAYFELGKLGVSDPLSRYQGIRNLLQVVRLKPEHKEAHTLLGETFYKQNDYRAAKSHLLIAKSLWPENGDVLYYLARIYYSANQIDSSVQHLSKAINLGTSLLFDAYAMLGDISVEKDDFSEALTNYQLAQDLKAGNELSRKIELAREMNQLKNDFESYITKNDFDNAQATIENMKRKTGRKLFNLQKRIYYERYKNNGDFALKQNDLMAAAYAYTSAISFADTTQRNAMVNQINDIIKSALSNKYRGSNPIYTLDCSAYTDSLAYYKALLNTLEKQKATTEAENQIPVSTPNDSDKLRGTINNDGPDYRIALFIMILLSIIIAIFQAFWPIRKAQDN